MTPRPWLRAYADDGLVHNLAVDRAAEFTLCGRSDRRDDGTSFDFLEDHRDKLPGDECAKCRELREAGAEVLMSELAEVTFA